ncbi:MAG TPA: hypothetical protein VGK93_10875 [Candidatus Eisenbacteria bacterium]|jgi:hypothetical protein
MTSAADPTEPKGAHATARTARWIAIAAFLIYASSGGGRIVGSDEVTMLQLSRAMLRGHIDVPAGATMVGRGGKQYTKNAAGQAVLALPLVAGAEAAAAAVPERRELAVRFVVSFFNAIVTGLLLGWFYRAARSLAVGAGAALAATVLLGFTTPLWVYAKSFMAEPLQGLGLLLALTGNLHTDRGPQRLAGAIGVLLATLVKPSMAPLAILCAVCALPLSQRPWRAMVPALLGFLLAVIGHLVYNAARFGNPFETGYGAQATPAAYTTPLLVGLYGLLLSTGKGVLWFAPALWLAPTGGRLMRAAGGTALAAVGAILATSVFALGLYGTFEHWAGDGSFGPRYLVPLLPLAFLPVGFALDRASRWGRRWAFVLGVLGLVVQLGGVSIHFGAQMREAGDYPYRLPLGDPRFMSDSHFNPSYSPITGHWRLLLRNLGEHLRGDWPRISGAGDVDPRVGVSAEDQRRLLHALDYWWLYARYAGVPGAPLVAALILVLGATGMATARLDAARRAEPQAP